MFKTRVIAGLAKLGGLPNTEAKQITPDEVGVFLHGNMIAKWNSATEVLTIQDAGFKTQTTAKRLRELPVGGRLVLSNKGDKGWHWNLHGDVWDGSPLEIRNWAKDQMDDLKQIITETK